MLITRQIHRSENHPKGNPEEIRAPQPQMSSEVVICMAKIQVEMEKWQVAWGGGGGNVCG